MRSLKHAYLIIAHNEFDVLKKLVCDLDHPLHDIYIHIDKKSKVIPSFKKRQSNVFIIDDRIDVRWGHCSQIKCEYALFEYAKNKEVYSRFNLISGTHLPLRNSKELYNYFENQLELQLLKYMKYSEAEIFMKLNLKHYFWKQSKGEFKFFNELFHFLWKSSLRLQKLLNGGRKVNLIESYKASNWVSLTPSAVEKLIKHKGEVFRVFKNTFCGDEFFVPYVLSKYLSEINVKDNQELLYVEFDGAHPKTLGKKDYAKLIDSEYLFARKFEGDKLFE